jgi:hypothetical protein
MRTPAADGIKLGLPMPLVFTLTGRSAKIVGRTPVDGLPRKSWSGGPCGPGIGVKVSQTGRWLALRRVARFSSS